MVSGESLAGAIAATVAYQDIFAFAPRASEIHRFLLGRPARLEEVEDELAKNRGLRELVDERDGFWFLRGKLHLVPRRHRFSRHSAILWPKARTMASRVAQTGLARAGLVTGSLAADNADEHADVDFLFVYPAARTYASYALVRALQRLPGMRSMCPNYALADDHLEIQPQNLFTAWELAKAVPMFGFDVYRALVRANSWVGRYLPNALAWTSESEFDKILRIRERLWDRAFDSSVLAYLEDVERRRKRSADRRDVGVDMRARAETRSMDRHSPTRSFHTMSELRYRLSLYGLEDHPLYPELTEVTRGLAHEMTRWGSKPLAGADCASKSQVSS